jgi:glycosyltransferase involved in cell wall biosynthesis
LRVIYVLEQTLICGGIRVVYEHLNRLAARGHEVALFALGPRPDWFALRQDVEFVQFPGWEALRQELVRRQVPAVATWWATAPVVHVAVGNKGFYLVQDIETSYYQRVQEQSMVLNTYKLGLKMLTISQWGRARLRAMGHRVHAHVGIGLDLETYRRVETEVDPGRAIAHARRHFLKDFHTLCTAGRFLGSRGFSMVTFGMEPGIKLEGLSHIHLTMVSDSEVARLLSSGGCFVHSAAHEGFGLPILEAMACGIPVACTEADGNLEFCRNGKNALVVRKRDGLALGEAAVRLLTDRGLADRLVEEGYKTARGYAWDAVIDRLEEALAR